MSNADQLRLSYVEEVTWGTMPSSSLTDLRFTSESLGQDTDSATSAEIRSDRQVTDLVRTKIGASGDINVEMSYAAFDDFLEAGLLSTDWSASATETDTNYSMASADNSINDASAQFIVDGYASGQWIKVSGFTETANNNIFKVVSLAAGKMVLDHGTVVTEASGDTVTINMGPQILNGTEERSFSLEKHYTDNTTDYAQYKGMEVDGLSLAAAVEAILTGSFTFIGKRGESAAVSGGSGYTAAPANDVMNAIDDVLKILEGGSSYTNATSWNMTLSNNLRERPEIGTLGAASIGQGKVAISGTVEAYYANSTVMDKYLDDTTSEMVLVLEDGDGNAYVIDLPSIKYSNGRRVAGGENTDIIAAMDWTAYMDATEGITIRIARFTA